MTLTNDTCDTPCYTIQTTDNNNNYNNTNQHTHTYTRNPYNTIYKTLYIVYVTILNTHATKPQKT